MANAENVTYRWLIEGAAGVGATYQFTKDATSNLRQKDDCYSEAIAGFLSGCGVGIYSMVAAPFCQSLSNSSQNAACQ
jgi:hypothetical protein